MTGNETAADKEIIARVVHEAIRAYAIGLGQSAIPPWEEAEAWMRDATYAGITFRQESPDAAPGAQHDQWMAEKKAAGWVHGPVKDADAKTHPLMVPYEELPLEERRKDMLFAAVVRSLSDTI